MVKGSIAMRRATLGTEEEEKVAITIRRDMVEAFTNGPFSLALEEVPHYGTSGLIQV